MEIEYNKKIKGNFRIAGYNLSHSELILLSEIDDFDNINKETGKYYSTKVEIKFSGVHFIELSTYLGEIEFLSPTREDYEYIIDRYNREVFPQYEKIFKIRSGRKTYYLLAVDCKMTFKYG